MDADGVYDNGADPELAEVVKAGPDLPADARKMILGVVRLTPRRGPKVLPIRMAAA